MIHSINFYNNKYRRLTVSLKPIAGISSSVTYCDGKVDIAFLFIDRKAADTEEFYRSVVKKIQKLKNRGYRVQLIRYDDDEDRDIHFSVTFLCVLKLKSYNEEKSRTKLRELHNTQGAKR